MSRRFARRMARLAALVIIVLATTIVGLAWLLGTLLGQQTLTAILPALAVLIAITIGLRLFRGIGGAARPLGDLIEASARVESGELGTQVEVRGPREIRALARAFNAMSTRLAQQTDERRRLLADVSHELRTPLTVIQGSIEGMLDGLYPADRDGLHRLLAETHHLERLIDDLRTLSLTDAGALALHRETVDLGSLAADVVRGFEPQAAAADVVLTSDLAEGLDVRVDAQRIRQVIGNLLSNAVRHTPSGGRVTVTVRHADGGVELEVADTGTGMAPDSAERAFDRFWRAGDTAGAGLGLAIVRDLVRAHGGDATLTSAPGLGTTILCRFPPGAVAA